MKFSLCIILLQDSIYFTLTLICFNYNEAINSHLYIKMDQRFSWAQTTRRRFMSSGEDSFVSLLNMIDTHSTLIFSTKQIIKKKKKS
jgi:hypothetical protein